MKMKALLTTAFGLILGLLLFAGCGGGGTAIPSFGPPPPPPPPTAPPTASPTHVYVSDGLNPGTIYAYTLPITANSASAARIAGSSNFPLSLPAGMSFDGTHRLFVANSVRVDVFDQPVVNGATPGFALDIWPSGGSDVKLDPAGDAFAAIEGAGVCFSRGCVPHVYSAIAVFTAPVTYQHVQASFGIVTTNTTTLPQLGGIAFDGGGNLWANRVADIVEFKPPFSQTSSPALQFANSGKLGLGLVFDPLGNMYAANGSSGIDVYRPPFTASTTKAFTINIVGTVPHYLAFDATGKLYVTTASGKLLVFSPPFTTSSAPAVTLALPGNAAMGVAIGP